MGINILIRVAGETLLENSAIAAQGAKVLSKVAVASTLGAIAMKGVGKVMVKVATK